ncbi:MAG TPA: DNA gyrase subunit A [Deltaproteobacteria bacterium]|nr:DNA gyrase subunit A [Candidatus Binatota bacterium]HIL12693.1 DNA gyrase subunit A [Deltaproteobacteria bacterium]
MEANVRRPELPIEIKDEMRASFVDYAMSVIIGRALPDVRDGLKPVHRRVLYAMYDLSNDWNKPPKKSARVVGDVIGKYHPHGDQAVYDTIVRMAQDFSLRYLLVDGQGNFGSVDGDAAAAMRYTEVRMSRLAGEMLVDIDKETVEFIPNYDGSTAEPTVMPARVPNLLINGATGIAVGMTTSIPPHNLREICAALRALIDDPEISIDGLMKHVTGPDFPTGATIFGRAPIKEAYQTGRAKLQVRANASTETDSRTGRSRIVINEIPYQVNKSVLIEKIALLVNAKKIEGISDLRDESDRDGMRIVVELKKDAVPLVVLNNLYKHTQMQQTFSVRMVALVDGVPKLLNLKSALVHFIDHRREMVIRATAFDLRKAEARLHILEGLKIALDNLDAVIKLIRKAKDAVTAREQLVDKFELSLVQAQAILDMRLQRLTGLERDKILQEHKEVRALIRRLKKILSDKAEVLKIISTELEELALKYGDERRTEIAEATDDIGIEDMIVDEEMVVTVSHEGYIKRNATSLYRQQRRGGRGKTGAGTKGEDFIEHMFVASTHSYLMFFTNRGRVYWRKVHELPQAGRVARGKAIVNLLPLQPGEELSAFLAVREFTKDQFVFFATRAGTVKKTPLMDFSRPRTNGIRAINLVGKDELISVRITNGSKEMALSTRNGMLVRFKETDVRSMGRTAGGVRGATLGKGDVVVSMEVVEAGATLLTVSANGYGKRSKIETYRLVKRGAKGVYTMKVTPKTGQVVGVVQIADVDDDVVLVTDGGKLIRMGVGDIRVIGRQTQGVRLVKVDSGGGEKVASVALVAEVDTESMADIETPEEGD